MEQQFQVTGMSCAACSAHVEKAVNAVPGVQSAQVNLLAGSMKTTFDPGADRCAAYHTGRRSTLATARRSKGRKQLPIKTGR